MLKGSLSCSVAPGKTQSFLEGIGWGRVGSHMEFSVETKRKVRESFNISQNLELNQGRVMRSCDEALQERFAIWRTFLTLLNMALETEK